MVYSKETSMNNTTNFMKYAANDKKFTSGHILYEFETFFTLFAKCVIMRIVKLTFIVCLLILCL